MHDRQPAQLGVVLCSRDGQAGSRGGPRSALAAVPAAAAAQTPAEGRLIRAGAGA